MMKRYMIAAIAALAFGSAATAQINSADAQGYLMRAEMMLADQNYIGVIDQLRRAEDFRLTAQQSELRDFLQAIATVHTQKDEAAAMLRSFLSQYPASEYRYQAMCALGDCYYGSDNAQALEWYAKVAPDALPAGEQPRYYYQLAYALLSQGELVAADSAFGQVPAGNEYSLAAKFYRGYIAYSQGRYAEAKPMLEAVKSLGAPCDMANYYLAQIYYLEQNYSQALSCAKALLQRKDVETNYQAAANRIAGESAFRLGNEDQARKYLNAYASAFSKGELLSHAQPSALYILGLFAYHDGDYEKAISYMQPATALGDAMSQSAYLYIGQAQMKIGDADAAIMAFDKALNMGFDPEVQENAYYNYAVASLQGARVPFGDSVATFENFLKKYPNSQYAPQAQKYIIAAYVNNKSYAEALSSINRMPQPTAETLRAKQTVLYMLGTQALTASNAQQAIDYLTQARQLAKHDAKVANEVQLALGEAYYMAGNYSQAVAELKSYLNSAPADAANRPLANYDLGYALFAKKEYRQAASAFQSMISHPGELSTTVVADAYARLGDCNFYQQEFAAAAAAYDKAMGLNPAIGDYALLQQALMEGYSRNHSSKVRLLQQLQSQYPNSALIPDAMLELTESYIQLGDNDSAVEVYEQLTQQYPNTPQGRQGYLQMALTLLNSGRQQEAVQAYKQVISRYPTSDEAAQAADQLKRMYAAEGRMADFVAFIGSVPNAPQVDASEADNLTFEAAEKAYITQGQTQLLAGYVADYPQGASLAKALSYLLEAAVADQNSEIAYQYACRLAEEFPDNSLTLEALAAKAQIEYQQGKGALALRTWRELAQKASAPYLVNMANQGIAQCAVETGDYQEAAAAAAALLQSSAITDGQRQQALYLRGTALSRLGDLEGARADWQLAAANPNTLYGIESAYMLAQSYLDSGDFDTAEKLAKKVADSDTPYQYWIARGFILLSDVYAAQGNDFKAQQYLKSLKENYPGDEADIFTMIKERIKQ